MIDRLLRLQILTLRLHSQVRQTSQALLRRLRRRKKAPSTMYLHNQMFKLAAQQHGFEVRQITEKIIEVAREEASCLISSSDLCIERLMAYRICGDKYASNNMLRRAGLPVPEFRFADAYRYTDAMAARTELEGAVVVKPRTGYGGAGVTVGVDNPGEFRRALVRAGVRCSDILIESLCKGRHWRITLYRGELLAAWERIPASVVGNGRDSVARLIDENNSGVQMRDGLPDRCPILISGDSPRYLAEQGYTLDSIPDAGITVYLQRVCGASLGGRTRDVTTEVSEDVCAKARAAAGVLGAQFAGVDIIADDIGPSSDVNKIVINEVNTTPDLLLANYDLSARQSSVQLAGDILNRLLNEV